MTKSYFVTYIGRHDSTRIYAKFPFFLFSCPAVRMIRLRLRCRTPHSLVSQVNVLKLEGLSTSTREYVALEAVSRAGPLQYLLQASYNTQVVDG